MWLPEVKLRSPSLAAGSFTYQTILLALTKAVLKKPFLISFAMCMCLCLHVCCVHTDVLRCVCVEVQG